MFNEINIELTSRCNKHCAICNRWRDGKEKGDIPFALLEKIEPQLPPSTLIHFHNNGEPLLYERLKDVMKLFHGHIKQFDTNGILLCKKAKDIEGADIISVSIIEDDPIGAEQLDILEEYLSSPNCVPSVLARCVGKIDTKRMLRLIDFGIPIVKRTLHSKDGRTAYHKKPLMPEDGICRDFLNHPAIDRFGNFSMCVRYDPEGRGVLGNVNDSSINAIWNSEKRHTYLKHHKYGMRESIAFCADCEYYGIPQGGE